MCTRKLTARSADYSFREQWIGSLLSLPYANCVHDFRDQSEPWRSRLDRE